MDWLLWLLHAPWYVYVALACMIAAIYVAIKGRQQAWREYEQKQRDETTKLVRREVAAELDRRGLGKKESD